MLDVIYPDLNARFTQFYTDDCKTDWWGNKYSCNDTHDQVNSAMELTAIIILIVGMFSFFGVLSMALMKWILIGRFRARNMQRYDLFVQFYHTYSVVTAAMNGTVLAAGSGTWLARLVYWVYGCQIRLCGNSVIWGTMLDQDLIRT